MKIDFFEEKQNFPRTTLTNNREKFSTHRERENTKKITELSREKLFLLLNHFFETREIFPH